MTISVFLLLKVTHFSAPDVEDRRLRIVLNSVCMGPFISGLGLIGLG